jgi:dipeptidyl aminopeptidase
MSSKVVEADAKVHSLAMAVAPVTSWRLYGECNPTSKQRAHPPLDSIYTERYMGLPQNNPDGYLNASISNVEGFKHVDFLLAHGSGDDNGMVPRQ